MFLIFRLFFIAVAFFLLVTFIGMFSLAFKVRRHLKDPFAQAPHDDFSPHDSGNVIEGEYKVLDEKNKNQG